MSEPASYLVVGWPVAHSRSPAMMTAAFRAAGLVATYAARAIPPDRWPAAMTELRREGIAGANVTVPLKEGALAGAARATEVARRIGAANTLVPDAESGGWLADNTDGPGLLDRLAELGWTGAASRESLVLGAGGSARAVVWALLAAGCPLVRVANRSAARAEALRDGFAGAGADRVRVEALAETLTAPPGGLVVNATSLGLRLDDPSPMSPDALAAAAGVVDLVYPDPPLARTARAAGVPADDGLGLLVAQGALSFARWTGLEPDRAAMRAAIVGPGA